MVSVEIPYKARIELNDGVVNIKGAKSFLDKIAQIKQQFGRDPHKWPLQSVATGEDILINEFIMKVNGTFKFCYDHEELCHCRNVPTEKVYTAIKNDCFKVEDVSRTTLAGTGCGTCRKDIESLINQFKPKA